MVVTVLSPVQAALPAICICRAGGCLLNGGSNGSTSRLTLLRRLNGEVRTIWPFASQMVDTSPKFSLPFTDVTGSPNDQAFAKGYYRLGSRDQVEEFVATSVLPLRDD